jgi:hypothetical protein
LFAAEKHGRRAEKIAVPDDAGLYTTWCFLAKKE